MLNGRRFLNAISICLILSMLLTFPNAYGYWRYGEKVDISESNTFGTIRYFPWEGEDILPDEEEGDETSQASGLQIVLDALNNKGLSGDSKLNQYIDKRIKNFNKLEYGSVDVKEDITTMLSDVSEIHPNFEFILVGSIAGSGKNKYVEYFHIYMIDITEFNEATAAWESSGLSQSDYENDPSIFQQYFYPVNRVLVQKDSYDQWSAANAEVGYTGYGIYEGSNNGGGQQVWTFSPDSWQPGTP